MAQKDMLSVGYSSRGVTSTSATTQITLCSLDVASFGGKTFDDAVFLVKGEVMTREDAGGNDYAAVGALVACVQRRSGTVTITQQQYDLDQAGDGIVGVSGALSNIVFDVSGTQIRLRITPGSGNLHHFGVMRAHAYQPA